MILLRSSLDEGFMRLKPGESGLPADIDFISIRNIVLLGNSVSKIHRRV